MTDIEIHGQTVFLETLSDRRINAAKIHFEGELTKIQTELDRRKNQ